MGSILLASNGQKEARDAAKHPPIVLLLARENYLTQNVNSAEVDKS